MAKRRLKVTKARRKHILDGDKSGGGHGPGRKTPGKSEFPLILTDDDIIDGIETILNDAAAYPGGVIPATGPPVKLLGKINGVRTVVIADPAKNGVRTAWPDGVKPNP
jgi:hypothetical protein